MWAFWVCVQVTTNILIHACSFYWELHTPNSHRMYIYMSIHRYSPQMIHTYAHNYCLKTQWQHQMFCVSGASQFPLSFCKTCGSWDTLDIRIHVVWRLRHTKLTIPTDKRAQLQIHQSWTHAHANTHSIICFHICLLWCRQMFFVHLGCWGLVLFSGANLKP